MTNKNDSGLSRVTRQLEEQRANMREAGIAPRHEQGEREYRPASHDLYTAAIAADDEYTAALVRQFGSRGARWTADESTYNAETRAAFAAKKAADAKCLASM